jgi:hypothetical protein
MTEPEIEAASPLSYLRRPHFNPEDPRVPVKAVLHALPGFLFLALNVWIIGIGLVWIINIAASLPVPVLAVLAAIVAVPCSLVCWGLLVHCIETEAAINY